MQCGKQIGWHRGALRRTHHTAGLTLRSDLRRAGGASGHVCRSTVTSGRGDLISGGIELFGNRPIWGYGSGAFGRAYRQVRKGNQQQAVSASSAWQAPTVPSSCVASLNSGLSQ